METKVCSCCKIEKDIKEFHKKSDSKDGHYYYCKECSSIKRKKYYQENKEHSKKIMKKYYQNNKSKVRKSNQKWYFEHQQEIKEYNKKYRNENKDKLLKQQKEYYENNKDIILKKQSQYYKQHRDEINKKRKEYLKEYSKKYYETHKEQIKEYNKKYRQEHKDKTREKSKRHYYNVLKNNELLLFKKRIRGLIRTSLDRKGQIKNSYTEEILGCNMDFFIDYLIKTYENNYKEKWDWKYLKDVHIDHVIPLASVNTEEDVIRFCHYTNLQLLKAKDNLRKSDKLDWSINDE